MKKIDFKKITYILVGIGIVMIIGCAVMLKLYLRSYRVFRDIDLVATVQCMEKIKGKPELDVVFHGGQLSGEKRTYPFTADEWVIDCRIVKWNFFLELLGMKRRYRLERISSRYFEINDEKNLPRIVYGIYSEPDKVWKFIYKNKKLIPGIDAVYGNSAFVPFAKGKIFKVYITNTGLMIRDISEQIKRDWRSVG
ncbi:MAG: hypothetical protein ABII88_05715 [Candidatus Omnitrophota bacterium]